MKFRPILFSTEMVQAILEGSKTQTRRVVNQPARKIFYNTKTKQFEGESGRIVKCPYGQVGDVLWVRESFTFNTDVQSAPIFKADSKIPKFIKWKPSIHMPKEACRLFLRIKDIRVERLQDISRGDAMAEGCPFPNIAKETFPTKWFRELWIKINGEQSWNDNPFVWVIEFERIEKPENFKQ